MSDGWAGPTWGQWKETVRDMEATRDAAIGHANNAAQWMAYAKRLEAELDEVWELYRESKGNASGQRRLKTLAMDELTRIDPANKILDPALREKEFDAAKAEAMRQVQRQR